MRLTTSITKIIENNHITCVLSVLTEGADYLGSTSKLEIIQLAGDSVESKTILECGYQITDFFISESNVIYAVDLAGHLYCSKPILDNNSPEDYIFYEGFEYDWSHTYISGDVLSAIAGDDDELWVATFKGSLLHIRDKNITKHQVANHSARIIRLGKQRYIFCSYDKTYEFLDNQWRLLDLYQQEDEAPFQAKGAWLFSNDLYIVTCRRHIFKRDQNNNVECIGTTEVPIHGCDIYKGKLFLACGGYGIYSWDKHSKSAILEKEQGQPADVFSGVERCYFSLPDTDDGSILVVEDNNWQTIKLGRHIDDSDLTPLEILESYREEPRTHLPREDFIDWVEPYEECIEELAIDTDEKFYSPPFMLELIEEALSCATVNYFKDEHQAVTELLRAIAIAAEKYSLEELKTAPEMSVIALRALFWLGEAENNVELLSKFYNSLPTLPTPLTVDVYVLYQMILGATEILTQWRDNVDQITDEPILSQYILLQIDLGIQYVSNSTNDTSEILDKLHRYFFDYVEMCFPYDDPDDHCYLPVFMRFFSTNPLCEQQHPVK